MMEKFKTTPLELDNTMPKELYSLIENKWNYCLNLDKDIRESTLANLFPELTRGKITKKRKKYGSRFQPKYRAFSISQHNIEDVVQRTTQMWKIIYGLASLKARQEDPFKGTDKDEEEAEKKEEKIVEETEKNDDKATTIEQQPEHSVEITQVLRQSPPHTTPIEEVIIKDIPKTTPQNINPLTA